MQYLYLWWYYKMMTQKTFSKLYRFMFIVLSIAFVSGIITIFAVFYEIKDCEVEYGDIIEWGYQNQQTMPIVDTYNPTVYNKQTYDSRKFMTYTIHGNVTTIDINQSGSLEILHKLFPLDKKYIITTCNGSLEGISRRNIINDVFFYKLAKII